MFKRVSFEKDRFLKLLPLKDRRKQNEIRRDILKKIKDLDNI